MRVAEEEEGGEGLTCIGGVFSDTVRGSERLGVFFNHMYIYIYVHIFVSWWVVGWGGGASRRPEKQRSVSVMVVCKHVGGIYLLMNTSNQMSHKSQYNKQMTPPPSLTSTTLARKAGCVCGGAMRSMQSAPSCRWMWGLWNGVI